MEVIENIMNRAEFERRANRGMLIIGFFAVLAIVASGWVEGDSWKPEFFTILCVIPALYVSWKIGLWLTRRFFYFDEE